MTNEVKKIREKLYSTFDTKCSKEDTYPLQGSAITFLGDVTQRGAMSSAAVHFSKWQTCIWGTRRKTGDAFIGCLLMSKQADLRFLQGNQTVKHLSHNPTSFWAPELSVTRV